MPEIEELGKVSDVLPKDNVKDRIVIGEDTSEIDGTKQKVIFESVRFKKRGAYDFAIIARTEDKKGGEDGKVIGYAGMLDSAEDFRDIPEFMELKYIKVDPGYFKRGVGANLILFSQLCAFLRKKKLICKPENPYEDASVYENFKDAIAPLSTEELRKMYKRLGFRKFKKGEVEEIARRMYEGNLNRYLLLKGFDPQSQRWEYPKYHVSHQIPQKKLRMMREIPLETKQRLWKDGGKRDLDREREEDKEKVGKYLIFDGKVSWKLAKKIKSIRKRTPVYWEYPPRMIREEPRLPPASWF